MQKRVFALVSGVLLLLAASVMPSIPSVAAASADVSYDGLTALGMPSAPQVFYPSTGYDVSVSEQGSGGSNESMSGKLISPDTLADHGPACEAPADGALPNASNSHATSTTSNSVYVCHDHVMTALNSPGFGEASIMPDAMPDWSTGPTTVSWAVSTFTSSDRDWWDVWIMPFSTQLLAPVADLAGQFDGLPKTAIHLQLCGQGTASTGGHFVCGQVLNNGKVTALRSSNAVQENVLKPSRSVRTPYTLVVSSSHITVSIAGLTFINQDVAIPFTTGVLMLDQESYDPLKTDACGPYGAQKALGGKCEPNTWHWSDITISNATRFSIAHPALRYMNRSQASNSLQVNAKPGSSLRFGYYGSNLQISFDGGQSWGTPATQPSEFAQNQYMLHQYLVPVPAGATSFQLRGANDGFGRGWFAYDFSLLNPSASTAIPTPTPTPIIPTPTATQPGTIQLHDTPCMITDSNGQMVDGTCTGTFTPAS